MQLCSNKNFLNEIKIWIHCKKKKKLTKIWYPQFPMSKQYILKQGKMIYFIIKSIHSLFLLSFGKWQHSGISKSSQSEGKIFEGNSCLEKSHGWRSLVGCSPWCRTESDTTEWLHFHFSLSCVGKGNGNTLQYSCLENPRDRGAWWAAVYGIAQSRTRLEWLSSSSSRTFFGACPITPHQQPSAPPRSLGND